MDIQIECLASMSRDKLKEVYEADLFVNEVTNPIYSSLSQAFYSEYFSNSWSNLSMVILQDGTPVMLLILYANAEASYFGQAGFLAADRRADVLSDTLGVLLFNKLSDQLRLLGISKIFLNKTAIAENYFHEYRLSKCSTAYVDLTQSIEIIKKNVRKSYKSLINWGLRHFQIQVINHTAPDRDVFDNFMRFHREVSGRITRSDKSWELQYEMICKGEGFALIAYLEEKMVSATFILHNHLEAYYGVGVYDRYLMAEGKPLAHALVYKAIEICKSIGLSTFVLGDIDVAENAKEENIAKFKSGFTNTFTTREFLIAELR